MDLEIVSTSERVFKVDDGAARCLLAAFPEAFRRIEKPAPAPLPTTWTYSMGRQGGFYAIQRRKGSETQFCLLGDPKKAAAFWPECPQSLIEQFAATRSEERVGYRPSGI